MFFKNLFKRKEYEIPMKDIIESLEDEKFPETLINECVYTIGVVMNAMGEEDVYTLTNKTIDEIENWSYSTDHFTEKEWMRVYSDHSIEVDRMVKRLLKQGDLSLDEMTEHIDHYHVRARKAEYTITHMIAIGLDLAKEKQKKSK